MQLHMDRWLLAALLLSAVCCSAAADGDHVDAAANWFNTVNTTICSTTACPAGQYANPADAANPGCKPCMIGTYKAAAGATCCEKCKSPELTFNSSDAQLVLFGATGCGCLKGFYKNTTLPNVRCLPCPKDSVADFGATSCTACVAPNTPSTLRDTCVPPCPAGTMNWKDACTSCTSFPKPAANPTPGGICKPCDVGTNSTNGTTCDTCLTGYFNTGNATNAVCNTCAKDYYNPRFWPWRVQQQKRQAAASNWDGKWDNLWPVFCKPCPADTFSPVNNTQAKCCPTGKKYDAATNKCV